MMKVTLVLFLAFSVTSGSKILLLCDEIKSKQLVFGIIANELIDRGHEVYWPVLNSSIMVEKFQGPGKHLLIYGLSGEAIDTEKVFQEMTVASLDKEFHGKSLDPPRQKIKNLFGTITIELLMNSEELMKSLEEEKMDIAIVDSFCLSTFKYLIAHRLGIPYVSTFASIEPWEARIPWLPSFVPVDQGSFTDEMTFVERMKNLFMYATLHIKGRGSEPPRAVLEKYAEYGEFGTTSDLVRKSALWIFPFEDVLLDYSKPLMANMISAGGVSVRPANPLSAEWTEILQSSQHGVVLASYGSIASSFPEAFSRKLLRAFSELNETVIFRFKNTHHLKIPSNVHISDWIPQMDLLASGHIKVFVTHCGANGQYEALASGVPMVGMPLFGNQFYNARRAVHKGYGVQLNSGSFEPDDLVNAINKVASDSAYKNQISKASKIFHGRRESPVQRVASGVEFILENGADVLRSHTMDMPLYQFLMLDLFCALALIASVFSIGLASGLQRIFAYRLTVQSVKSKTD